MSDSSKPTVVHGFNRAARAFEEFVTSQAFGGILLVVCTIVALVWANGPLAATYFHINHLTTGSTIGAVGLHKSLQHWVNDGLMVIFFLLVGLEIKREVLTGELQALHQAVLPIVAAIGGMVVPAAIFLFFNHGTAAAHGWGIPMATDIAFAIGVLSLLGKRRPKNLLVLLTAIAIIDDLGAVLVIALFYTQGLAWFYLLGALLCFLVLVLINRFGVLRLSPYLLVGLVMWYCFLMSGVHATIAGVLLAFTIPAKSSYAPESILKKLRGLMGQFSDIGNEPLADEQRSGVLRTVEDLMHEVETPLQRLEHALHPLVTFIIVPLFVLFNAGVDLSGVSFHEAMTHMLAYGVVLGLVLGKCIGIFGSIFLLVKSGLARLPRGVGLKHVFAMSLISGIGFTMSIFIAELAYDQAELITMAKIGILTASLIAAVIGFILMYFFCPKQEHV